MQDLHKRKNRTRRLAGLALLAIASGAAVGAQQTELQAIEKLDPAMAVADAESGLLWYDVLALGLEGQAWKDLERPFDRLPARANGVVTESVWALSRHAAGLCVRFVTDSPRIAARWSLTSPSLAMSHMPATGVSGLDLYARANGAWRWVGVGRPELPAENKSTLLSDGPDGAHEYLLYLPLYNGIESLQIGVRADAALTKAPPRPADCRKPILVWGTSIVQGGCASRPGMAYPAILGRRLNREVINLGFSGNGKMDPELAALVAEIDVAAYIIDCAPNMTPELITERTEPLVRTLRAAHPDTPIVLVENIIYQQGWFVAQRKDAYTGKNVALKAAFDRMRDTEVAHLYYVPCENLLGDDSEATVDGTHPTDVGFLRMADALTPALREILK